MSTTPSPDLSSPPKSSQTGTKPRHVAGLSNLPVVGRSLLVSRVQQVANKIAPTTKYPSLVAFLSIWEWIGDYVRDLFHTKERYRTYPEGESGVFSIPAPADGGAVRMVVTADWATGTLESKTVAENMKAGDPHYTIHLGDVYYMGEKSEVEENCFGKDTEGYTGVTWPVGSRGSFALMGNHEMYSGGGGYFNELLHMMGLFSENGVIHSEQLASYFCLELPSWIVLGLDTGYHAGGIPLLSSVPVVREIPIFNVDARFDARMMAWLKQTAIALEARGSGAKPVVVLTHHQPMSAFELAYAKPVKQLEEAGFLNGREFVWLYGHEHRLTVYNKQRLSKGLTVYPRCIGHGGMPVEVTELKKTDSRILYYDARQHPIDDEDSETMVGYNGHAVLLFEGNRLTVEYRDIVNNELQLTETFAPRGRGLDHKFTKPVGSGLSSGQQTS